MGEERSTAARYYARNARVRTFRPPPRTPIVGVPRNFNAGRMLVIVTLYAILFSLLRLTDAPPILYPMAGIFCAAVFVGQMLLFGGREPRFVSCVVGACAMPLLSITAFVVTSHSLGADSVGSILGILILTPVPGAITGYLIGTICAGAFLVMDRRWNAGQIIEIEPIVAEIVSEDETQQDRPKLDAPGEEDPWSSK